MNNLWLQTPGEGEHKIMDFIRYEKSQEEYDANTRHCLYGLDADLIMLGLCSHEPHFSLLREEVKFTNPKKSKAGSGRTAVPEETNFHLLHLSLMREYLEMEFSSLKKSLPFGFDLEAVIDDWVSFVHTPNVLKHESYFTLFSDADLDGVPGRQRFHSTFAGLAHKTRNATEVVDGVHGDFARARWLHQRRWYLEPPSFSEVHECPRYLGVEDIF